VREQMRQRMDRPREKEIARLMGKREEGTQTTAEKARAPQKRHPNVVQGVLKREKWKNGFEVCEHTESGWLEEAWAAIDRGEEEAKARTYYTGGGTVRVTQRQRCQGEHETSPPLNTFLAHNAHPRGGRRSGSNNGERE
jgi:hypothetical protein